MIFTNRTIKVSKGKSTIDEPVILYRGDFEVELRFTIMETKFRFKSGVNLVDTEKASHAQLALLAPDGTNVFTEIGRCEDGTAIFVLSKEMIDELSEVGKYSFQIRLFDYYRESRITIPPVEFGIEVREPVASEDHTNAVNSAMVGYSIAKTSVLDEPVPETFDGNGQYNKTDWETGDRISEGKLNKLEDAVYQINQNEIKDVEALNKQMVSNFNVLQTEIDNIVIESGNGITEVIQARGQETTLNNRLNKMESQSAERFNEVNSQLDHITTKKIYQFDSVDSMKKYDLKVGEVCETLGYYSINDGGKGKYHVIDENIECDEAGVIALDNGLKVKLTIENNSINFKQLGAISSEDFDCKPYIDKYINICNTNDNTYKLYIPIGKWYFSETHMHRRKGVNIVGEPIFPSEHFGAMILPFNAGQEYIWKLGGFENVDDVSTYTKSDMMLSPHLSGLTFSTDTKGVTHVNKAMLYIDCVEYGTFDDLFFFIYQGTALSIRSSWELCFGSVNFRGQKNNTLTWGKPSLLFANRKMIEGVTVPNISAVEFNSIMFEAISGDCILAEPQAHVTNCNINYINAEIYFDLARATEATTNAFTGSENIENFIHFGVVRGTYRYLTIGTINIDDNRNQYVTLNDNYYYFGGVLVDDIPTSYTGETERYYQVNASNINFKIIDVNSKFACIFGRNSDTNSYINIGILSYADVFPNAPINAKYMNKIRIASLCGTSSRANPQPKELIDAWEITRSASITTDETSHNALKLTYKKSPSNDTHFGLYTTFPYDKVEGADRYGVVIVAKGETGKNYTLNLFYSRDGVERSKTITRTGTGEYEYITESVNASFGSYFEIRETSNNVNISKFGFITL